MSKSVIRDLVELGFPWQGRDPFLFTVHHLDTYPAGNQELGPVTPLTGRNIGSDFSYLDGWSMYFGDTVPGFPQHPHRGFETVTVVRRGYVDHSDSLGATARYGEGDTQWLTTGKGIMHAEMFPLLDETGENRMELFQIWLNLPPESKMVDAYFGMLWKEAIPTISPAAGVLVDLIAGGLGEACPPAPPPDSWASRADSDLAIWLIRLAPEAGWDLPPADPGSNRMLFCFLGDEVAVDGTMVGAGTGVDLAPGRVRLDNHGEPAEFLLQQAVPVGAPVYQLGPFVMNTPEELRQAVADYQRTQFGGWPWSRRDPVHPRSEGRFAIHADGRVEHRDRQPTR